MLLDESHRNIASAFMQESSHKRVRRKDEEEAHHAADSNDADGGDAEGGGGIRLDADITPEEMQMMQTMGIPFVSLIASAC